MSTKSAAEMTVQDISVKVSEEGSEKVTMRTKAKFYITKQQGMLNNVYGHKTYLHILRHFICEIKIFKVSTTHSFTTTAVKYLHVLTTMEMHLLHKNKDNIHSSDNNKCQVK